MRPVKKAESSKKAGILLGILLLLILMFFISINAGYKSISAGDLLRILTGGGSPAENLVVLEFRLPRICIAILTGIGFSLSGCVLQGITKNPLSDPGILGINAGAGFVVVVFIIGFGTLNLGATLALPFFSFLGALITSAVIYLLSARKHRGIHPVGLVLNGIAIQAGLNAWMTLLVLTMDDSQYDFVAVWQAGSIWNSTWRIALSLFPWILAGMLYLFIKAGELDLFLLKDDMAAGLGMNVAKEKGKLLFAAVAMAAASVAVSGSLHFVGLIGPHLARKLVGARHRLLLPASALTGALLVLTADTIGRTVIQPFEIPAGLVAAIIGAPYFIFLLIAGRRMKRQG
jgi:iron complex transport system permease protein